MRRLTRVGPLRPEQVSAARALLGWSQMDLAHAAGLARSTIAAFETAARPAYSSVCEAVRKALEDAGIEFVYAKDGSYGVILLEPSLSGRSNRAK
jgi:DNA-binding XRE family transcriptional regulator